MRLRRRTSGSRTGPYPPRRYPRFQSSTAPRPPRVAPQPRDPPPPRDRLANLAPPTRPPSPGETPPETPAVIGVSINDLRKNLRDINERMDRECLSSAARYGIVLDASLITGIDPPPDVESALAAINTANKQV